MAFVKTWSGEKRIRFGEAEVEEAGVEGDW